MIKNIDFYAQYCFINIDGKAINFTGLWCIQRGINNLPFVKLEIQILFYYKSPLHEANVRVYTA